jgi:hypothetical protein
MNLQSTIERLASQFAAEILAAVRSAPLEELLGDTPARTGRTRSPGTRLPRRSPEDVIKLVDRICGLLSKAKDGLRAEAIREKLGIEAKELPRPIAQAIKDKRITKSGDKRATTYKLTVAKKKAPKAKKVTKATNGAVTP